MPNEQTTQQQLTIHSQYIKDLSFENPNSPAIFTPNDQQPEIQINVNVTATPQEQERVFEVALTITANASRGGETMFVAELAYAGIVSVAEQVDTKVIHPLVMIEGPRLIFPFARQIISEITQAGGFLPLNMQPIDFVRVYQTGMESQNAETASQPNNNPDDKPGENPDQDSAAAGKSSKKKKTLN